MSEYVKNKYETCISHWMIQINGNKNTGKVLRIQATKETIQ